MSLKPEEVFRTGLADGGPSAPLSWNNASQLMEQPNGNRTHKTFTALAKLRLTRRATLSGMGGGGIGRRWEGVGGVSGEKNSIHSGSFVSILEWGMHRAGFMRWKASPHQQVR